jgi:hypothetical protein
MHLLPSILYVLTPFNSKSWNDRIKQRQHRSSNHQSKLSILASSDGSTTGRGSCEPLGNIEVAINIIPRSPLSPPGPRAHYIAWQGKQVKPTHLVSPNEQQPRPGNTVPCYLMSFPALLIIPYDSQNRSRLDQAVQTLQRTRQTSKLPGESVVAMQV